MKLFKCYLSSYFSPYCGLKWCCYSTSHTNLFHCAWQIHLFQSRFLRGGNTREKNPSLLFPLQRDLILCSQQNVKTVITAEIHESILIMWQFNKYPRPALSKHNLFLSAFALLCGPCTVYWMDLPVKVWVQCVPIKGL